MMWMRNKSWLCRGACTRARALIAGEDPRRIAEDWQDAVDSFIAQRKKYLLY
jgi:hypothetical protein